MTDVTNEELLSFLHEGSFLEDPKEDSTSTNVSDISSKEIHPNQVAINVVFIINSVQTSCTSKQSINCEDNPDTYEEVFDPTPTFSHKKARKKKVKVIQDIRETYGDRILKAINEVDFPPLLALLNSICCPTACLFVNRQSKKPHNDASLYSACFKGPLNIAQYYYGIMTMEPDAVITLKKSKFHPESPKGLIVIKLEYRATKMYNVETTYGAIADTVTNNAIGQTDDMDMSKLVEQVHDLRDQLPVRKKAVKVYTKGLIRAFTDQDKRITQILMDLNLIENDFSVEK